MKKLIFAATIFALFSTSCNESTDSDKIQDIGFSTDKITAETLGGEYTASLTEYFNSKPAEMPTLQDIEIQDVEIAVFEKNANDNWQETFAYKLDKLTADATAHYISTSDTDIITNPILTMSQQGSEITFYVDENKSGKPRLFEVRPMSFIGNWIVFFVSRNPENQRWLRIEQE